MRFDGCVERKIPDPIIPYRAVVFESCDEWVRLVPQPRSGRGGTFAFDWGGANDCSREEEMMSKTSSKGSAGTMVALTAGGAIFVLVSAALAQGVQPPAVQAGPGAGPHTTLQPGGAAGVIAPQFTPPPGAGVKGELKGAGVIAPQFVPSPGAGTGVFKAEPPPSPSKSTGATNPGPLKSPRDAASMPVGPRGAAYLKSPIKGDPKAKLGDKVIGEDGARICATGKAC
jgi:hypothetical protein